MILQIFFLLFLTVTLDASLWWLSAGVAVIFVQRWLVWFANEDATWAVDFIDWRMLTSRGWPMDVPLNGNACANVYANLQLAYSELFPEEGQPPGDPEVRLKNSAEHLYRALEIFEKNHPHSP